MSPTPYDALIAHTKTTAALDQVVGILMWDQEVMMPRNGNAQRSEQSAALEGVLHARNTDPRIAEWIAAIDIASLDPVAQVNVRECQRTYDRATKVPAELATEIARLMPQSQRAWADARKANAFAEFAPTLKQVLALKREEAACVSEGGDTYDALLDTYEPGAKSETLGALLGSLRPGLTSLRERIAEKGVSAPKVTGTHPAETQMAVARRLADAFAYDWDSGRLDYSVHPFSSGNNDDSRITTRVNPDYVFDCFYSTIHEVGHSRYEQNMPRELAMTPAGQYASMGVHESQSRLAENQIGRSREFCEFLFGVMRDEMSEFGLKDAEELYRAANAVGPGYIRTEADEVHYNLHVLMRFDLERALVRGDLQVDDLEAAWNDRFEADFGRKVDCAANGVLQDVHWSVGLFGYFPTYSLGNIYAGELFAAMRKDIPNLNAAFTTGDTSAAMGWLFDKVHSRARTAPAEQIIADAAGHIPSAAPLLAYLEEKFSDLYDL